MPRLYLFTLKALIVVVYLIAGINKINPYWLFELQPMKHILSQIGINEKSFLIYIFSYFGLFFDLLIGPMLLVKRTRYIAIALAMLFHLINFFIFIYANGEIGFFPFIMIATLILFVDSEKLESYNLKANARILNRQYYKKAISFLLLFFLFIQITLPFRHVLFKGYVDYNGIGQRFSWRLKNMYKKNSAEIITFKLSVKDGKSNKFNLSDSLIHISDYERDTLKIYLTKKQKTNILYYPNMIPAFAQKTENLLRGFVKEKFNRESIDFIVSGNCEIMFMGRSTQLLFDTTLDLTKITNSTYKTNAWLNPLKQKPWDFK